MSRKKIILITMIGLATVFTSVLIFFAMIENVSYKAAAKMAEAIPEKEMALLLNDPTVQQYISEDDDISTLKLSDTDLPIKTRSEAIKKVTKNFTTKDMKELSSKLQKGLSEEEKKELIEKVTQQFSEEEIVSLKLLALQELEKRKSQSHQ